MWTVCGVPLHNPTHGWDLLRATKAIPTRTRNVSQLGRPGRSGYKKLPAPSTAPRLTFVVRAPLSTLEALIALFEQPDAWISRGGSRRAAIDVLTLTPKGLNHADFDVELTAVVAIPGVHFRDTDETIGSPVTIANPVQTVDVLPGISGEVDDAMVFVGGAFDEVEIRDSRGSFVRTTASWAHPGYGLLHLCETRQSFRATVANPWVPLADVSERIETSGTSGLVIFPYLIGGDPTNRVGRLRVTTEEQTGVTFRIRARGAYAIG